MSSSFLDNLRRENKAKENLQYDDGAFYYFSSAFILLLAVPLIYSLVTHLLKKRVKFVINKEVCPDLLGHNVQGILEKKNKKSVFDKSLLYKVKIFFDIPTKLLLFFFSYFLLLFWFTSIHKLLETPHKKENWKDLILMIFLKSPKTSMSLKIKISSRNNSSLLCHFNHPSHIYLESWVLNTIPIVILMILLLLQSSCY